MQFLLDTCVLLEPIKPTPNAGVVEWLAEVEEDNTFISVITIAELRHHIESLSNSRSRRSLECWLREDLCKRFTGRILPVDAEIADAGGRITALCERMCRPIELRVALIAATIDVHVLTLVTEHVADFQGIVKNILTPWAEASRARIG